MNLREIENLLLSGNRENDRPEDWDEWGEVGEPVKIPGLGLVTVAHQEEGFDGGGDHVEVVLRVEPPMTDYNESLVRYFRKTGYYSSYEGTEWDGAFEEVEPRQVTVTQYFTV